MRNLTRDSDPFAIRDKIVRIYLRKILRRFRQLNQNLLVFDEINSMNAVYTAYDEVVEMSVEALKQIAKQTYRWICDDDFPMDMWLAETTGLSRSEIIDRMLSGTMDSFVAEFLQQADPVTHYKFYDEADRKRSRLFEAIESVRTSGERKKQIEVGMRYWVKQFEQTADNLVDDVVLQAYRDNGVKYVMWMIMNDAKVCNDCYRRKGKIYPIDSPLLRALHWNCRCWWIPIRKNVFKK